jgi:hypothetical protein
MLMLVLAAPIHAQQSGIEGHVLIRALEIGVEDDPNSLFLGDAGRGRVTELLVSNAGIFAPWFDWSPDGRRFAFLSPTRRGINSELWLGDANVFAPNLRTPLFDLNLTPVAARWNPQFNIVAVGTQSENAARDGLYLYNTNSSRLVFLREEALSRSSLLDWAHGGFWLVFTGADGSLNMIHAETESRVTLQAPIDPPPAFLPDHVTGWTADDAYYAFSNTIYGGIAVISTDGDNIPVTLRPEMVPDPFQIKLASDESQLVALYDNRLLITDLTSGEMQRIDINIEAGIVPDYGLANDGSLLLNTFVETEQGDYATCMILRPGENTPQIIVEELGVDTWTHTRCQLLEGGTHIAMMGTSAVESYESLPEFWLFDLMVVPVSLRGSAFLTNEYVGFEAGNIGFSPEREQLIFREGDNLVVYNLRGQKMVLASLQQLRLTSNFIDFEFRWQP